MKGSWRDQEGEREGVLDLAWKMRKDNFVLFLNRKIKMKNQGIGKNEEKVLERTKLNLFARLFKVFREYSALGLANERVL